MIEGFSEEINVMFYSKITNYTNRRSSNFKEVYNVSYKW